MTKPFSKLVKALASISLLWSLGSHKLEIPPILSDSQTTPLTPQELEEILHSTDFQVEQETRDRLKQKYGLDGIIVLGAGRYNIVSKSRVNAVSDFFNRDYDPEFPIITSGGTGLFCGNLEKTEAEILKQGLAEKGITGVIKTEDRSRTTYENFKNSKELIHLLRIEKLGVATNSPHMRRAIAEAKQAFSKTPAINCELHPIYPKNDNLIKIAGNLSASVYEVARTAVRAYS